jgi:signal transduction histidine kinase
MKFWLFLAGFYVFVCEVSAQKRLELHPAKDFYSLEPYLSYIRDESGKLTLQDILSPKYQAQFRQRKDAHYSFGYTRAAIWLKVSLFNPDTVSNHWILEMGFPPIDVIDIYYFENNQWQVSKQGDHRPFTNRSITHRFTNLSLRLSSKAAQTLYIRVQTSSSCQISAVLRSHPNLWVQYQHEQLFYGIFFGFLLVAFSRGVFGYWFNRERNNLWYCCFILSVMVAMSGISGHLNQYISYSSILLNHHLIGYCSIGVILFLSLFQRDFLHTYQYLRWWYWTLTILIGIALVDMLVILIDYRLSMQITNIMGIVSSPLNLIGVYWIWWRRNPAAMYFALSSTFFLIGSLVHMLRNAGVLPLNFWTIHVFEVGIALEILFLGMALAYQYKRLFIDRHHTQKKLIQQLQENESLKDQLNQDLSNKVQARTYELQEANDELNSLNEELSQANESLSQQTALLENQKNEADELNKLKDKLFSIIAHDLRSPLNTLKGLLSLIEDERITPTEIQNVMPEISKNTTYTINLLDNLLHWAKAQMEEEAARPEYFDFRQVVSENFDLIQSQAAKKQISLDNNLNGTILKIYADKAMIHLVLRNLLSNAIKFTPEKGKVKVEVSRQNTHWLIAVKDTGLGIKAANLPKLFGYENFTTRGTANEKGTGLGLVLCREFVEKNGGKIWAESQEGFGSAFYFTLPEDSDIVL